MAIIKLAYPTSSRAISADFPNYSSGAYHGGIDFPVATGTPVKAAADGKVTTAKELNYSYGHYLIIDHGGGIQTLYAHNSQLLVKVGQTVTQGQQIARSGSTGNSTGPHVHFEVRKNGVQVNPLNYLDKTISIDYSDQGNAVQINEGNSWAKTLIEEVVIENYSGKGYSKVGSGIHNVYRTPDLNKARFTTINNEEFTYLGKVKGRNIYYVRFAKGGNSYGEGFLKSSQCGGRAIKGTGTKTIKIIKDILTEDDLKKLRKNKE